MVVSKEQLVLQPRSIPGWRKRRRRVKRSGRKRRRRRRDWRGARWWCSPSSRTCSLPQRCLAGRLALGGTPELSSSCPLSHFRLPRYYLVSMTCRGVFTAYLTDLPFGKSLHFQLFFLSKASLNSFVHACLLPSSNILLRYDLIKLSFKFSYSDFLFWENGTCIVKLSSFTIFV